MNEAVFLTEKEFEEIKGIVNMARKYTGLDIDLKEHIFVSYGRPNGVTITVQKTGKYRTFKKNPVSQTWNGYINELKAFLLDSLFDSKSDIRNICGNPVNKWDVLMDIKNVIRKEGKDEVRYSLPNDNTLLVEVLCPSSGDGMEIAVERLDEHGNTIESATDDYDCEDSILIAMIENAVLA